MGSFSETDRRGKLSKATVDKSVLVSPPNRTDHIDIATSKLRVSEILGEAVLVSPQVEMATDEIAELITNNAFHVGRIDDSESALVSLKPVVGIFS